ncbi:MAG: 50S ribosomal protein L6 [Pseudohongiella sp.]|jgi:large subunit ribosomal protein L6|nr:50S ribosomal protein L6 [Pseudohongiella sp.]MDP1757180.1 50S ribosomal protein L6 [Pseudohongiella sp.]MDP2091581.1 50S ribosomal protein L6 [Pseudohongiella sp.]MDP2284287.1 50S ribosomal protein L6 [Pseudohongiella sp.]MDP2380061.1 50S ribosomal protein L6 [Pseudohongiella sp.]
MSRVAKNPITLPKGVETVIAGSAVTVKGSKGSLNTILHNDVQVVVDAGVVQVSPKNNSRQADALAGTFRALINNMVTGVTTGFQRKLTLQGVGYRAKAQGDVVNIAVGYSHPIDYKLPSGVTAETPTQTEIVLSSTDKQLLGQVASEIRRFRPPEPYKGKGIRYSDEVVYRKEAKKK